jgi:hypothetical protein
MCKAETGPISPVSCVRSAGKEVCKRFRKRYALECAHGSAYQGRRTISQDKGGHEMKKWKMTLSRIMTINALRAVWILVAVLTLVLGSGAPTAFGVGGGG